MADYVIFINYTEADEGRFVLDEKLPKAIVFAKAADLAQFNYRVRVFRGVDLLKLVGDYIQGKFYGPKTEYSFGLPTELHATQQPQS